MSKGQIHINILFVCEQNYGSITPLMEQNIIHDISVIINKNKEILLFHHRAFSRKITNVNQLHYIAIYLMFCIKWHFLMFLRCQSKLCWLEVLMIPWEFYLVAGIMGYYTYNKVDLQGLEIALSNLLGASSWRIKTRPSELRYLTNTDKLD